MQVVEAPPEEGVQIVDFAYSKYGTNTVGLTIFTNNDLIKEKPDLVRRFVKATGCKLHHCSGLQV